MRCVGLSALGNQCQNEAGKDGRCRRHRGPVKARSAGPTSLLVCKSCGTTSLVRAVVLKRHLTEKPSYYVCHVCNKSYKHTRPDGTILVIHGAIAGDFFAFTVRKPNDEEAESVLRAKALVAQVSWPNGYGDA